MLESKSPEIYAQFLKGRFTVNKSKAPYSSVSSDQALEQSINRPAKDIGGIIGFTKKNKL